MDDNKTLLRLPRALLFGAGAALVGSLCYWCYVRYSKKASTELTRKPTLFEEDNLAPVRKTGLEDEVDKTVEPKEEFCACGMKISEGGCTAFNPKLVGTVKLYEKHIIICAGGEPSDWSAKITKQKDTFAYIFKKAVDERKKDIKIKYKLTNSDERSRGEGTDLIVFPDKIRYIGVTKENVELLIEDCLIKHRVCEEIQHEPFGSDHLVLVCCHANRDTRCGASGPEIVDSFRQVLAVRELGEERVMVRRSSHLGGHKYAGVIVVYPAGDWYGFVSRSNIETLVDNYISSGMLVQELWRGRMGIGKEDAKRFCAGSNTVSVSTST